MVDIGWTLAILAGITGTAMVVFGMFDDLVIMVRSVRSKRR